MPVPLTEYLASSMNVIHLFLKEVLRRENQGLKVHPVDGSSVFSMTGARVRPFRLKIFFTYKRNKANLDPFHMCFTISL